MKATWVVLAVAAVAAVTLSAVAAAGPALKKQRVAITAAKGNHNAFLLHPLQTGPIAGDSGSATFCCWRERVVTRDGQRIEIDDPLETLTGRHGTLVLRVRIEWVNAGNGYTVGTGTWKVVRGSGAYKNVKGSGRTTGLWDANDVLTWRSEGFLRRS